MGGIYCAASDAAQERLARGWFVHPSRVLFWEYLPHEAGVDQVGDGTSQV